MFPPAWTVALLACLVLAQGAVVPLTDKDFGRAAPAANGLNQLGEKLAKITFFGDVRQPGNCSQSIM